MSELPPGWAEARFDEINSFSSQTVDPAQFPDEHFDLYSVPAFPSGQPEAQLGAAIGSTKQLVAPDDVLICKINPRINRVWQVMPKKERRQIASSEWIVMRSPELHPGFLRYYFSSSDFREVICEGVTGVGGSLTEPQPKRVATFGVPIAPINEQKRITDKLDAVLARVDACRERLARVPAIFKRFRQAVLAAATSGKLAEEWREETKPSVEWRHTTVGSLLTDIRYGTAKKCLYEPKETPVLRIPNILDGRVNHDDMKYAEFEKEEFRKLVLVAGDILMIRSNGSLGLVGRTALVTEQEEGFLYAGYLIRLRVNQALARPAYLSISLASPESRDAIERVARSTSGVNNINTEEIKALAISVPGVEEQDEIVRRVAALFAYADRLEARYIAARAQVERLTPTLLAKAFRGELVPQDPNDEPASVLLERIRAARAATEGVASSKRRKGSDRPKTPQKAEVTMLTRQDIQDTHLTTILKERGPLTAEALWSASQLDIDDFYDQLKDEEARGLLQEKRGDLSNTPRMLEAG